MPELLDMPAKQKFSFPGVFDMSKKEPAMIVVPVEEKLDEEPLIPIKKPAKKVAPVGERKSLKLGKMKG
jgi:hypothetical protein